MATTYKVLSQLNPTASSLSTLYTVPASTSSVVSTISIANQGAGTNVRVAVQPAGASIDAKHYIVYDTFISANDAIFLTLGITLATTDVVSVYAGTANVSFGLFGTELT